uniref:E-selectin n=1 Tax=Gadus morhua TaxID=8049 RepID=A0ABZ3NPN1_GADMO
EYYSSNIAWGSLYRFLLVFTCLSIYMTPDLSTAGGVNAWMYHHSIDPPRTWSSARTWCQQRYTDMVAIQNQGEIAYLNQMLPSNPSYYWIGIRKVAGVWTWVGTNRSLTPEAQNWAVGEPNHPLEDCVEMYVKREKDTAKWNDERCNKKKGTVCYTASCSEGSCGNHADCVETIGNFTCQCHPGFLSPRCEEAVTCDALSVPQHGRLQCHGSYGPSRFNSSCRFHCDLGYSVEGPEWLQCQASGRWDHPAPRCQVEQCAALKPTSDRLLRTCLHPIANDSFNSTCAFSCEEGFELSGQSVTICDHAGRWTAEVPTCSVIACAPISPPAMGNMTCVDSLAPFSFGSSCSLTCLEGYTLAGSHTLACSASGQWSRWSGQLPVCQAVQCSVLSAPPHGSLSCSNPNGEFSFSSRCALTCDEGFLPNGTAHTECSSLGSWSQEVPRCLAVQCSVLSAPPHGSLSCSNPHGEFSFSSRCALTCDEGFLPNGTAHTECSSLGSWSQEVLLCLAVQCSVLSAPPHGSLSCSNPHGEFSFSSRCALTCDEGFLPNGTAHTECSSLGSWSQEVPRCLAVQCSVLSAPPHGSLSCSNPHGEFSFSSRCALTCDEGFQPNGTAHTECSSLGSWSQEVPLCLARSCPLLVTAPHHGWMNCSHPHSSFSYASHCDLGCSEGFRLSGTPSINCNTSGDWSGVMPTCKVVQCEASWLAGLTASPLSLNCSHPRGNFSFGSRCRFACAGAYSLNGTEELLCSSSGRWSDCVPEVGTPLWSAVLMYSGAGAASLAVLLCAVGAGLLVAKQGTHNECV